MSLFNISKFSGEKSLMSGGNEPEDVAQRAENCVLRGGVIRPLMKPSEVAAQPVPALVADAKTLFRHEDGRWWSFADDIHVVRSPVVNDAHKRTYWTMPDVAGVPQPPRYRNETDANSAIQPQIPRVDQANYNRDGFALGVPAPSAAPAIDLTAAIAGVVLPDDSAALQVNIASGNPRRAYTFTDFAGQAADMNAVMNRDPGDPLFGATGYPYFFDGDDYPSEATYSWDVHLVGTWRRIHSGDPQRGADPGTFGVADDTPTPFDVRVGPLANIKALTDLDLSSRGTFQEQLRAADNRADGSVIGLHIAETTDEDGHNYNVGAFIGRSGMKVVVMFSAPEAPGRFVVQPIQFIVHLEYRLSANQIGLGTGDQDGERTETEVDVAIGRYRNTSYVYTYVSIFGEEGPPSPPSENVYGNLRGLPVHVSADLSNAPPNIKNEAGLVRFYRANAGEQGAAYQFVGEEPISSTGVTEVVHIDTVDSSNLAEPLQSATWYPPPAGLRGLTRLESGALCGFIGRDLYFSVINQPHAWPEASRINVEDEIVAIAETPLGVHVLTKGVPVLLTPVDNQPFQPGVPLRYTVTTSKFPEACIDANTVVRMDRSILYFAPDGLAELAGLEGRVITDKYITPDRWRRDYVGKGLRGYYWEDRYVALPDGSVEDAEGFMIESEVDGLVTLDIDNLTPTAGYAARDSGQLFLVNEVTDDQDRTATKLMEFAGALLPEVWTWQSRRRDVAALTGFMRGVTMFDAAAVGDWVHVERASKCAAGGAVEFVSAAFLEQLGTGALRRVKPPPHPLPTGRRGAQELGRGGETGPPADMGGVGGAVSAQQQVAIDTLGDRRMLDIVRAHGAAASNQYVRAYHAFYLGNDALPDNDDLYIGLRGSAQRISGAGIPGRPNTEPAGVMDPEPVPFLNSMLTYTVQTGPQSVRTDVLTVGRLKQSTAQVEDATFWNNTSALVGNLLALPVGSPLRARIGIVRDATNRPMLAFIPLETLRSQQWLPQPYRLDLQLIYSIASTGLADPDQPDDGDGNGNGNGNGDGNGDMPGNGNGNGVIPGAPVILQGCLLIYPMRPQLSNIVGMRMTGTAAVKLSAFASSMQNIRQVVG